MFLPEHVPDGTQITRDLGFYSKVLLPALAALVPAAVTTVFKLMEDHSRSRRRVVLTDRIAALAKQVAEMPDVPVGAAVVHTPRSILSDELAYVSAELASLQGRGERHVVFSATNWLRSALLLYRPQGVLAWLLHGFFYIYVITFCLVMPVVLVKPHDPEFWFTIIGLLVLGIPPVIVRYFAAKLHRKYCAKTPPPAAPPPKAVTPPGSAPMATPAAGV